MSDTRVKLSNGKDITELLQFLLEENKRMEEEFGEPLDIIEEDFEKNIQYLPEKFKSLCREIYTVLPQSIEYKFDEPDSTKNLEYSPEGQLLGSSFLKLIEKITDEATTDLIDLVFYTFPLYATPKEMLEALIWRHNVPTPPLMSKSENLIFQLKKVRSVQSKVASLLKKWIKLWPNHFKDNKNLKTMLQRFLEDLSECTTESFTKKNCKTILQHLSSIEDEEKRGRCTFGDLRIPDDPILPKEIDFKMEPLLLWSHVEVSRQLSLIENDLLKKVGLGELLGRNWEKPNKDILSPNVVAITKRFARGRELFISAVVRQEDANNRVKVIKSLLEAACECINNIHNYESPFIINSALKSDPIRALENTVREVKKSANHRVMWNKLEELYDSNFEAIRQEMETQPCSVPCILALRQILTKNDIVRPDFLESGLINIAKHRVTADVIHKIRMFKETSLVYHPIKILYNYLLAQDFHADELELYNRAKSLENN